MNKKTKKIIAMASLLSAIMFTSCTNDDFFIEDNYYDWSQSLSMELAKNALSLSNSGVKFVKSTKIDGMDIDGCTFLDSRQNCFPVYHHLHNSRFNPVSFDFLKNDTTNYHVPANIICTAVDNVIKEKYKYDFIKLEWSCDNILFFYTIAAFDKSTGELVYDNLLTNISNYDTFAKKSMLTRGERIDFYFDDETIYPYFPDQVEFTDGNGLVLARRKISVVLKGSWVRSYYLENGVPTRYTDQFQYDHANINKTVDNYTFNYNYKTHADVENNCAPYSSHINFRVLIWAGPSTSSYNNMSFSNISSFTSSPSNGNLTYCIYDVHIAIPYPISH
ncbi:MAG: hypothetical protein MJY66_05090 [Bacteroidaceae bacterium]|nr:hypothetical protein [Bacteroidaceae bacterium]